MEFRDLLRRRAIAYKRTFGGEDPDKKLVLLDLARFCHAQSTTHVVGDTHGSAQLEGRRQVWLRLNGYLGLSDTQIREMAEQAEE